jgi:hypothetical protein
LRLLSRKTWLLAVLKRGDTKLSKLLVVESFVTLKAAQFMRNAATLRGSSLATELPVVVADLLILHNVQTSLVLDPIKQDLQDGLRRKYRLAWIEGFCSFQPIHVFVLRIDVTHEVVAGSKHRQSCWSAAVLKSFGSNGTEKFTSRTTSRRSNVLEHSAVQLNLQKQRLELVQINNEKLPQHIFPSV